MVILLIRCFIAGKTKNLLHHWVYNRFLSGYEAYYFQGKVVNKMQRENLVLLSTREKLVLHSKGKIGAAQQREKFGAAEQREIWCCTIFGAREKKRDFGASCLKFRVQFRVAQQKRVAAANKRDFLTLAFIARQRVRKEKISLIRPLTHSYLIQQISSAAHPHTSGHT